MENEFVTEENPSARRTGSINSIIKAMELTKAMLNVGEPVPLHVLSKMTGYQITTPALTAFVRAGCFEKLEHYGHKPSVS